MMSTSLRPRPVAEAHVPSDFANSASSQPFPERCRRGGSGSRWCTDDRARGDDLAAADLDPEPLRGGVTTVAGAMGALLLRHRGYLFDRLAGSAPGGKILGDLDHRVVLAVTQCRPLVGLVLVDEATDLRGPSRRPRPGADGHADEVRRASRRTGRRRRRATGASSTSDFCSAPEPLDPSKPLAGLDPVLLPVTRSG